MVLPVLAVGALFVFAVGAVLALMAYREFNKARRSDFFKESVRDTYELSLSDEPINEYIEFKESLCSKFLDAEGSEEDDSWMRSLPDVEKMKLAQALMKRLVSIIDTLAAVEQEKPGYYKLWQQKLISERYWNSLTDLQAAIEFEIKVCKEEAMAIHPGWEQSIWPEAVQRWRQLKAAAAAVPGAAPGEAQREAERAVEELLARTQEQRRKELKKCVKAEKMLEGASLRDKLKYMAHRSDEEKKREEMLKQQLQKQQELQKQMSKKKAEEQEKLAEKAMQELLREEEKGKAKASKKAKK